MGHWVTSVVREKIELCAATCGVIREFGKGIKDHSLYTAHLASIVAPEGCQIHVYFIIGYLESLG